MLCCVVLVATQNSDERQDGAYTFLRKTYTFPGGHVALERLPRAYASLNSPATNSEATARWSSPLPANQHPVSRPFNFGTKLLTKANIALGPSIGADYGELHLKDALNDGVKEVIVERNAVLRFEEHYLGR